MMVLYGSELVEGDRVPMEMFLDSSDSVTGLIWNDMSLSVNPSKLSRKGGKFSIRPDGTNLEAYVPFSLAWLVDGYATAGDVGSIEVDYELELSGYNPNGESDFAQFRSSSTSSSALALNASATTTVLGQGSIGSRSGGLFESSATNSIRFNVGGEFRVTVNRIGTSPVEDHDGHTVADRYGTDVTAIAFLHSSADSDPGTAWNTASSTETYSDMFLRVAAGDVLTIDALTSGSITATIITICEYNMPGNSTDGFHYETYS